MMKYDISVSRRDVIASTTAVTVLSAGCLNTLSGNNTDGKGGDEAEESMMTITSQLADDTDVEVLIHNVTDDERLVEETVTVTPDEIHNVYFPTNPSNADSYPDIRGTAQLADDPSVGASKTATFPTGTQITLWAEIVARDEIIIGLAEV